MADAHRSPHGEGFVCLQENESLRDVMKETEQSNDASDKLASTARKSH